MHQLGDQSPPKKGENAKRTMEGQEWGGGRVKELRLLTQQNKVSGEIQFLSRNVKGATSGLERAI